MNKIKYAFPLLWKHNIIGNATKLSPISSKIINRVFISKKCHKKMNHILIIYHFSYFSIAIYLYSYISMLIFYSIQFIDSNKSSILNFSNRTKIKKVKCYNCNCDINVETIVPLCCQVCSLFANMII